MRAAAAVFVGEALPQTPTLLNYGAAFSDFLARFEPAAELVYLPGVARLDRYWTEAHIAPDEDPLDPEAVTDSHPDALAGAVFHLRKNDIDFSSLMSSLLNAGALSRISHAQN